MVSGAQCTSTLGSAWLEIWPKSPAGPGCLLKEERRGQSAALNWTLLQQVVVVVVVVDVFCQHFSLARAISWIGP